MYVLENLESLELQKNLNLHIEKKTTVIENILGWVGHSFSHSLG